LLLVSHTLIDSPRVTLGLRGASLPSLSSLSILLFLPLSLPPLLTCSLLISVTLIPKDVSITNLQREWCHLLNAAVLHTRTHTHTHTQTHTHTHNAHRDVFLIIELKQRWTLNEGRFICLLQGSNYFHVPPEILCVLGTLHRQRSVSRGDRVPLCFKAHLWYILLTVTWMEVIERLYLNIQVL